MIRDRSRLETTRGMATGVACIEAGIAAADPQSIVDVAVRLQAGNLVIGSESVAVDSFDRVLVVGMGKAAGAMAVALEDVLGDRIETGVVVTTSPAATDRIETVVGGHPVPNEAGMRGAQRIYELVRDADATTLILVVVTGGGSALLSLPARTIPLAALQTVTDRLVTSGASIQEINAVRKHVSAVKGGRLAQVAVPATVVGVVVSDVIGNDLSVIASGPTAPDESTFVDAVRVLDRYNVTVADAVREHLEAGIRGEISETPASGDAAFEHVRNLVLADGWTAIEGARAEAVSRGYNVCVLSSRVRGEAQEAAKVHVGIAEECLASSHPIEPPAVLVSGGEVTVTVRGDGTGGPNLEFALRSAIELDVEGICVASVDTDGRDGGTDAAGAIVNARTVKDHEPARTALKSNDSYSFLSRRDAVIRTGETGTNVNDLHVVVVEDE